MWRKENHLTLFMGMQASTATLENSVEDPQDFKIELPYNPAIALLSVYPQNAKTLIQRDPWTSMFIAALSTIAKMWKQPKCPSTEEWIKKMWFIYTMKY